VTVAEPLAILVLAALALAAIVFVSLPLLREPTREDALTHLSPAQEERLRLREERDAALAALRELEFDHRTGTIADEDYRRLVGEHRARAAAALRALDAAEEGSHSGAGRHRRGA
jgi:hypothetical protein